MTAVIFKFQNPDGTPVAATPFTVSLRKSSFDEALSNGILMPGVVQGLTDAEGKCTLELAPGYGIYYLTMAAAGVVEDSEGCIAGLRYKFIVPESATAVRAEDLIFTTPVFSRPWDEVALSVITDAKVATLNAAVDAKLSAEASASSAEASEASAVRSEAAAVASEGSQEAVEAAASRAAASEVAAGLSAEAAGLSEQNSTLNASQAEASATAAGQSAVAALGHKDAAAQSAQSASEHATASQNSAQLAETSKLASDNSAAQALEHATAAEGSEAASAASALASETARLAAEAALASLEPQMAEMGNLSLASGVYPPKPLTGAIWRISEGGTVDGVIFAVGNALVYSKVDDIFYRLGSSEGSTGAGVLTVNGRDGDVTLQKGDVGLGNVDNTADANKPVSSLQLVALNTKVDKVANKGLSTNDFDASYKSQLDGLPDSLASKVSKVAGKDLSSNDFTNTLKDKLDGIAANATANNTDAYLLNRANHTGTQDVSSLTGLAAAIRDVVLAGFVLTDATAVTAADKLIVALGKLQAQLNNKLGSTAKAADSALLNGQPASFYAPPAVMTGATASVDGTKGLVPAPTVADRLKVLSGAGTWVSLPTSSSAVWGNITGTLSAQADLQTALNAIKVDRWRSVNLSLPSTPTTYTHTLGVIADAVNVYVTLTSAVAGWPIGTIFRFVGVVDYGGSGGHYGVQVNNITSSSFQCLVGTAGITILGTTGSATGLAISQCTIQVELLAWT
jgi:hypothetical protein